MTLRYLNIEVALGVVALSIIAQRTLNIQLPSSWYFVVPVTTWAIYVLDRVLDARTTDDDLSGRHQFARRNQRSLFMLSSIALAASAVVALVMFPLSYWIAAIILGALTVSHRLLQRTTRPLISIFKDVNVAVVYTLSAWAVPVIIDNGSMLSAQHVAIVIVTTLLVLCDVLWLSIIDHDRDARRGDASMAVVLGVQTSRRVIRAMATTALLVCAIISTQNVDLASIAILSVTGVIYLAVPFNKISDPDLARILIECALLAPLILCVV
jgi:4-hydroxybenzoate polyprenyltransferase